MILFDNLFIIVVYNGIKYQTFLHFLDYPVININNMNFLFMNLNELIINSYNIFGKRLTHNNVV